ncbi:uncharacterized protein LOC133527917 [Cydia pomonella]|uniref:uncharacterized protein LOC133527917 n=1 Tax=Cydia pomonella TaxID=82600 RepID=UPI002ADDC199|nr:uncharacterized protein LOC133527917 [Cydia pomonella]
MSGFLDVKYPFKSNLGLNPFKTWKRQWCILRPSPTCAGGGSLAVYCSEAGASAGAVELPPDSVVRRAKSRSRPFAFAVFSVQEPHKPRILLAAQTLQDAQLWMDKIRALLDGKQLLGSVRDSFSVTIMSSSLSRKLLLCGDGQLTITADGVVIARSHAIPTLVPWKHVTDVQSGSDKNRIVVGVNRFVVFLVHLGPLTLYGIGAISVLLTFISCQKQRDFIHQAIYKVAAEPVRRADIKMTVLLDRFYYQISHQPLSGQPHLSLCHSYSGFHNGGSLTLSSPLAIEIATALNRDSAGRAKNNKRLSRSEGDLRATSDGDLGDTRRSSWSTSGPAEVALDDTDLVMMKEAPGQVQLSRCAAAGHLASPAPRRVARLQAHAGDDGYAWLFGCPLASRHRPPPAFSIRSCLWQPCSMSSKPDHQNTLLTLPVNISLKIIYFSYSMSDRRSLLSVASGIYEEIPELPDQLYTKMSRDQPAGPAPSGTNSDKCSVKCATSVERVLRLEEPTYESVAECVYATMRRTGKKYPPPLPPRLPFGTMKLGESWNSRINTGDAVTRHSSLGSLPRCCSVSSTSSDSKTKTLPKGTRQVCMHDPGTSTLGLEHSSLGSLPRCCSVSSTYSDSKTKTLPKGTRQVCMHDPGTSTLGLEHSSLGSLPRCCSVSSTYSDSKTKTLPKGTRQVCMHDPGTSTLGLEHSSLGSLPRCCSVSSTYSDSKTKTLPKGTRQVCMHDPGTSTLGLEHSSLGSLPRCCSVSSTSSDSKTKTLPKGTRQVCMHHPGTSTLGFEHSSLGSLPRCCSVSSTYSDSKTKTLPKGTRQVCMHDPGTSTLGLEHSSLGSLPRCCSVSSTSSDSKTKTLPKGTRQVCMHDPGTSTLGLEHSSLGSLPRCCSVSSTYSDSKTKTLPKGTRQVCMHDPGTSTLGLEHSSLGSLPRCCSVSSTYSDSKTKTLPKGTRQVCMHDPGTSTLGLEHSSLGSLPRCCSVSSTYSDSKTKTLPKGTRQVCMHDPGTSTLGLEHSSLGSLPRCCSVSSTYSDSKTKTLPKGTRQVCMHDPGTSTLGLEHSSLGSLPRCCSVSSTYSDSKTKTLPKGTRQVCMHDPGTSTLGLEHSSLGSLPRCCSVSSTSSDSKTKTLPKGTRQVCMHHPGTSTLGLEHSSLGSLPRCCSVSSTYSDSKTKTLPKGTRQVCMHDPGTSTLGLEHSSLGSLPRCCSVSSTSSDSKTKTLPKGTRQAFSVFRKRLKSDSRIMSPKSETAKENKDVETKKKKFDFTPTRDIFKNFKVSRKMKNLKIAPGSLSKVGETKSCEFLDETEHVTTARCSKSVECLEPNDEFDDFDADLSLEFNDDSISSLTLPQEIVDLILRSEHINKIRLKHQMSESDYMPMSPICPPAPIEHHYIAMSPSTNLA